MKPPELCADAVFEGGGVKGIGLVGALSVAEKKGYKWMNVAGTSAGAIVASLVAAGYTGAELEKILGDLDYSKFKDPAPLVKPPVVGPLSGLLVKKGIYEGEYFENWIRKLLKQKQVETFNDLIVPEFKDDQRYRFKLNVIVSDITRGRLLVLPQDIADYGVRPEELNVAWAVRMSMSIPFFYRPVILNNAINNEQSYFVDGGLLSNFPIWLFDCAEGIPQWPTLGFKLVEPEEGTARKIGGPISMLSALFSTMMEAHDARYIKEENFVRTIPIPTLGVKTTEFDISAERSRALFQSGRQASENFFQNWDFEGYVKKYREGQSTSHRGKSLRENKASA